MTHLTDVSRSLRFGISRLDVLVLTAVAVVLTALTLPAVEQAREDARRQRCADNLKRLGVALHTYHDAHGSFPAGWLAATDQPGGSGFGWQAALLPQIGEDALAEFVRLGEPLPAADTRLGGELVFQQTIPVYRCPADRTGATNPMRGGYGTSNYSANFGDEALPRWITGRRTAHWPGHLPTPHSSSGLFSWNSGVRIREVTDGAANTFLLGERGLTSSAGIWPGVADNIFENDQVTDCDHVSRLNRSPRSFSSLHGGGANFVLVDGSVRFVADNVESLPGQSGRLGLYQKLANRYDGQTVGE